MELPICYDLRRNDFKLFVIWYDNQLKNELEIFIEANEKTKLDYIHELKEFQFPSLKVCVLNETDKSQRLANLFFSQNSSLTKMNLEFIEYDKSMEMIPQKQNESKDEIVDISNMLDHIDKYCEITSKNTDPQDIIDKKNIILTIEECKINNCFKEFLEGLKDDNEIDENIRNW